MPGSRRGPQRGRARRGSHQAGQHASRQQDRGPLARMTSDIHEAERGIGSSANAARKGTAAHTNMKNSMTPTDASRTNIGCMAWSACAASLRGSLRRALRHSPACPRLRYAHQRVPSTEGQAMRRPHHENSPPQCIDDAGAAGRHPRRRTLVPARHRAGAASKAQVPGEGLSPRRPTAG